MGMLRGCCKFAAVFGVVPLSVLVAVLLETPAVIELAPIDPGVAVDDAASSSSGGATDAGAAKKGGDKPPEFGTAISDGMGSGSMFDRIAFAYDSTNKFMSLGLDQRWRSALINDCMRLQSGDNVLDLATGTADVSILAGTSLKQMAPEGSSVMGLDPSSEMLRRGVAKVEGRGLNGMVRLVKGDAQDLSSVRDIDAEGTLSEPAGGVGSDSIDKISMSFGIRNVPDRSLALREMRRVLRKKESSKVCILEFSLPDGEKFLSKVARTFITKVVPFIGRVATMNSGGEEYQYLERSILKFPQPRDFAAEMGRAGLTVQTITSFAYGAVNLYTASPATPAAAA